MNNSEVSMQLEYPNIFDVVVEDKAVASDLQTRSDLMIAIRDIIATKQWSQTEAAKHMGHSAERVSE
ncbi:MAG: helix-turn-helix domain-containing protein [Chitinophagales bacterium]|nr:helix-turn-helix domain-containing protein [Chitinophagales bacterium]